MTAYICCNPDCKNILYPTAPIQAFASIRNFSFKLPVFFTKSGAVDQKSLDEVTSKIAPTDDTNDVKMTTNDSIGGTLGDFKVHQLDLQIQSAHRQTQITQTITLHCSVCNSYCQYTV